MIINIMSNSSDRFASGKSPFYQANLRQLEGTQATQGPWGSPGLGGCLLRASKSLVCPGLPGLPQGLSRSFRVFQSLSESFRVFQGLSESPGRPTASLKESGHTRLFEALRRHPPNPGLHQGPWVAWVPSGSLRLAQAKSGFPDEYR